MRVLGKQMKTPKQATRASHMQHTRRGHDGAAHTSWA